MSSAETLLQNLPIDNLQASTTNPRRHFDRAALDELKASIAVSGIQTPLLVRELDVIDALDGVFEIVAGERRFRAARELGIKTVPCLVRAMSDEEVREIQIIENLQRAGVPPLEEAEAFGELLERLGSIPAVAAKLGKEVGYVAKCLQLRSLTFCSVDALREGLITIDHALLLARLAETEQNAALKFTLDRNAGSTVKVEEVLEDRLATMKKDAEHKRVGYRHWKWEPESVVRLKAYIETQGGVKLSRAPWSLTEEDYLLPDVGPCAECPSNAAANTPLFGDLDMEEPTCTNGACFAAKTQGFVQLALRKAGHDEQAKPQKLMPKLSWKSSSVKPSIVPNEGLHAFSIKSAAETANPAKVLRYGQWIDAKPGSCPNVRAGVMVDWSDAGDSGYRGSSPKLRKPGEVVQVCIAVGCEIHPKAWEKQPVQAAEKPKAAETPAQREARQLAAKAYEETERPVRHAFMRALLAKAMEKRETVLRKMVEHELEECWSVRDEDLALAVGIPFVAAKDADERTRDRAAAAGIDKYIGSAMVSELIRLGAAIQHVEVLTIDGASSKAAERRRMDTVAKEVGFTWVPPDAAKSVAKPKAKKAAASVAKRRDAQPVPRTLTAEGIERVREATKKAVAERKTAATNGAKA